MITCERRTGHSENQLVVFVWFQTAVDLKQSCPYPVQRLYMCLYILYTAGPLWGFQRTPGVGYDEPRPVTEKCNNGCAQHVLEPGVKDTFLGRRPNSFRITRSRLLAHFFQKCCCVNRYMPTKVRKLSLHRCWGYMSWSLGGYRNPKIWSIMRAE